MAKMIRTISEDGSVMACAIDSTDIVAEIEKIHKTSAVVTAALGRLSTAASLMGGMLKNSTDTMTLRFDGKGQTGVLIAVSNSNGDVKSYVSNPIVELPLNQYGKLDVSGAVGTDGVLSVVKDIGLKEPYVGQIPIASGEIAEDITSYYAVSEQIPTVCGLGVLVNPDLSVQSAGGYLVQLLPFADESCIDVIEKNLETLPSVSSMYAQGLTPEEVCFKLLAGLNPNVLDEFECSYKCDCSKHRVENALISLGEQELQKIIEEQETTEVSCHFCNKAYNFSKHDIENLLKTAKR